jgi:pimeloyl-ACP methyl ester carboxylesterase
MKPSAPSDPPQLHMRIGGHDVWYSVEGADGPAIVAIPGLPGSSRDFRWLAPGLASWARVVRFDPPGYGASPRPQFAGMSAAAKADLVLGLMRHLGIGSAALLGHSFGCVVAAHAAAARPAEVTRVLLLAPPGIHAHFPVPVVRAAAAALRVPRGRSALAPVQRAAYRAGGFPSFLTDDELTMTTLDSGAADFGGYRAALRAARAPTLVAWARDDRQVPARNSAALHALVGAGPRIEFASGGHNIQKTRAVELGRMIRSFCGPSRPSGQ